MTHNLKWLMLKSLDDLSNFYEVLQVYSKIKVHPQKSAFTKFYTTNFIHEILQNYEILQILQIVKVPSLTLHYENKKRMTHTITRNTREFKSLNTGQKYDEGRK